MEDIRLVKFGGRFSPTTEEFADLKKLVELCDDLYPGIDIWYQKKVVNGFRDQSRTAYLIYQDNAPVGAGILRTGENAKICSFRIVPEAEKKGYGKLLMALLAREMRSGSERFHFTIPEHVWEDRRDFFSAYGLKCLGPTKDQYRLFDRELYGGGDFGDLWRRVLADLPSLLKKVTINGLRSNYDLVMSVQPPYAQSLFNGNKRVEVRRRFSKRWTGSRALVYSSTPIRCFVGSFGIAEVKEGRPDDIWAMYSGDIGCSREEYENYTKNAASVFALVIEDAFRFKVPVTTVHLSNLVTRDLRMPQSYSRVHEQSAMEEAASISTLLQSTL
jgi:predicted transcriptional regulator